MLLGRSVRGGDLNLKVWVGVGLLGLEVVPGFRDFWLVISKS